MKVDKEKVRLAMANACLTTNELAEKSKVSRISIGRFLNGKTTPRPITVGRIAKALNVRVEELLQS